MVHMQIELVRTAISPIPEKLSTFCSDALIASYLTARNWNVKKATKMLKDSLQWRLGFKPEQIRWVCVLFCYELLISEKVKN